MVVAGLAASGCVTDKDFKLQQQQVNTLQLEVRDLKDQSRLHQMEMERLVGQTRMNLPELRLELDRMRTELQRLTDGIEVTELRGGLPAGETLTLRNQLDHIRARLDRLETRLRLPPLSYKVVEDARAAQDTPEGEGPTIEVGDEPDADEVEYGAAKDLFKGNDYDGALEKFRSFLEEFPKSKFAASARFYVGECLYKQKKFEEAILEYQKVVKDYPKSSKVSTALLKQAYSFLAIGDETSGKLLLRKVVRSYPKSYAAGVARKKLKTLK